MTINSRSPSPRQFSRLVLADINAKLEECRRDGALDEAAISDLVCQAQVESNRMTDEIERCRKEILERLPTAESDLGSVSIMVTNLSQRLSVVRSQLKVGDERPGRSVGFLVDVDRLRTRIEHCAKLVSEIQNWKHRLKSIEVLFGSREFGRIASEIQEMEASVQMLTKVPDYDRRLAELSELRTKLETMCSPHLLAAIQAGDCAALESFRTIFQKIGRESAVTHIYLSSRTDWLLQLDAKFHADERCRELHQWLPEYYAEVLAMLIDEIQSLPARFPDVPADDLVRHVAKVLKRKVVVWLEQLVVDNDDSIDGISSTLQATNTFLIKIGGLLDSSDDVTEILLLFASAFTPFSSRYLELESAKLSSASTPLRAMLEVGVGADCRNTLQSIEKSSEHLFAIAHDALSRCQLFGQGVNVKAFQQAIDSFVSDYIERLLLCLRHIRDLAGCDSNQSNDSEWATVGTAFRLIRFAQRLREQLSKFDAECITSISRSLSPLLSDGEDRNLSSCFYRLLLPQHSATMDYLMKVVEGRLFSNTSLLVQSKMSAQKLEKSMKTFAFDTMLRESRELLRGFSTWSCWTQASPSQDMAVLSSQPSDYITQLGDQLFGFVPELEAQLNLDETVTESSNDMIQWLRQLSAAVVDDLLAQTMALHALSEFGSRQLASDFEYLANILSALGIEAPSCLTTLQKSLLMSPHEVSSMQIDSRSDQSRVEQITSIRRMSSFPKPRKQQPQ